MRPISSQSAESAKPRRSIDHQSAKPAKPPRSIDHESAERAKTPKRVQEDSPGSSEERATTLGNKPKRAALTARPKGTPLAVSSPATTQKAEVPA
jgi:hypothetical protein